MGHLVSFSLLRVQIGRFRVVSEASAADDVRNVQELPDGKCVEHLNICFRQPLTEDFMASGR